MVKINPFIQRKAQESVKKTDETKVEQSPQQKQPNEVVGKAEIGKELTAGKSLPGYNEVGTFIPGVTINQTGLTGIDTDFWGDTLAEAGVKIKPNVKFSVAGKEEFLEQLSVQDKFIEDNYYTNVVGLFNTPQQRARVENNQLEFLTANGSILENEFNI